MVTYNPGENISVRCTRLLGIVRNLSCIVHLECVHKLGHVPQVVFLCAERATEHIQLACERIRISGCRFIGGEKRQPEIRLHLQAIKEARKDFFLLL